MKTMFFNIQQSSISFSYLDSIYHSSSWEMMHIVVLQIKSYVLLYLHGMAYYSYLAIAAAVFLSFFIFWERFMADEMANYRRERYQIETDGQRFKKGTFFLPPTNSAVASILHTPGSNSFSSF